MPSPTSRKRSPVARTVKAITRRLPFAQAIGWYLRLCQSTARWEILGAEPLREMAAEPRGFVMAFWHECLPLMPAAWARLWATMPADVPRKPGLVLVSRSRDGTMIAASLARFGLTVVAGSSSRGGGNAGRVLLRGVRAGNVAVVVPDGPRGPRRQVSDGAGRLAAMAGVPIVPCGAFASPARRLGSWDRMILPMPFARCVAVVGRPIDPAGMSAEDLAAALSLSLNEAMASAEGARAR
ncbi:lysophospholipid acyltransferase family protein [Roseomonas populi]|uniref:Lysophospholipid acyltransferase family protein n=1 Tax=Roseomonas populi TaxID=3121582 RepID=A0ABT1X9C0_9PROT|nr:lysophospholipid acyltransferase family protein [Roseomonas pecuniae]MCR0984704.1 lysophospholipid acyltransferase family protein [Roseomonas pecuniae]